jgi:hypothetical protein
MDLTVLAVPGCPNVMLLEERLAQMIEGRRDVTVSRQVITDEDAAASWGMHGSPTLLVDGIDPFAEPEPQTSVSCRLYRDGSGRADGAPSVSHLRQAIGGAAATATGAGSQARLAGPGDG